MTLHCPECGSSKHLSKYGRKWRLNSGHHRILVPQYICWKDGKGCGKVTIATRLIKKG